MTGAVLRVVGAIVRTSCRRPSGRFVLAGRAAIVLLVVLAPLALLFASAAEATSDTTIGFDGLAGGTVVTNQYAASGITFGRASDYGLVLGNSDCGPPLVTADPTEARSAPNDAIAPRCSASDSSSVGTFVAFTLARFPTLHEMILAPTHPSPGRYRIVTNPGSPPITRIDRLDGLRPRISAQINGAGTHRHLAYRVARQAGQSVTFFEISAQVHRSLGTTTGGSGTLAFTASHGRGRRQIVAEVYGDGVPRVRLTVTSYRAPGLARLGRVHHLRVRRRRAVAAVSFGGVPGAREYRINLALSDGTGEVTTTRAHRATFAPIFVDIAGTITIQAVGDGLATLTGPPVRARLSPLFGRGKPARQPKRR